MVIGTLKSSVLGSPHHCVISMPLSPGSTAEWWDWNPDTQPSLPSPCTFTFFCWLPQLRQILPSDLHPQPTVPNSNILVERISWHSIRHVEGLAALP